MEQLRYQCSLDPEHGCTSYNIDSVRPPWRGKVDGRGAESDESAAVDKSIVDGVKIEGLRQRLGRLHGWLQRVLEDGPGTSIDALSMYAECGEAIAAQILFVEES
jgi:hypothetical protein